MSLIPTAEHLARLQQLAAVIAAPGDPLSEANVLRALEAVYALGATRKARRYA